jgi:peptide/nickel transport system permease protein
MVTRLIEASATGPGAFGRRARTFVAGGLAASRHPLVTTVIRRLLLSIPLLFLVSALVFVLMALMPGDITQAILGPKGVSGASPADYRRLAHQIGIDTPLYEQYWRWLRNALQGNLGNSLFSKESIAQLIGQRFPVTLSLTIGALVVSVILGVGLGIISAVRGRAVGRAVDALAMIGIALPVFWLAAQMVFVFAVDLRWFPAIGYVPFAQSPTAWFRSLVLPVLALALGSIGGFAKLTREGMLDALASEYIRIARANGIRSWSIIFRHALRTASLQVVTLAGLLTVGLLTGTVFVEKVFGLPGLGSVLVSATNSHDVPVVQGITVFFTLIIVVVNLIVDVAYTLLSPRVRLR